MPALDSLPRKIGPYRVIEKIGEGGMGVVYLGTDAERRPVAIKVLGSAVANDPSARQRLAREVETMRRVRNRYVAAVLDADVQGPAPYIVTRYVPGRTLEDAVRQDGPLRGMALDALAEGLAEALAAIHAAGVIHRDLKPGNVMLDAGQPVIIDFGIAHIADSTRLTKTGLVMGTPGYLAPEVIEGTPSSGGSDVHSWGATAALSTDPQARPSARWLAGQLGMPRADTRMTVPGAAATRFDYPSTRTMAPPPAPMGSRPPAPLAGPPVRVAYRSPAEAARDVADLLPPVVPAPAPPRRQEPAAAPAGGPGQPDWQPPG